MNPEDQNVAIAEFCGWKREEGINPWTEEMCYWRRPDGVGVKSPPNFSEDLNAMHEAETKLFPIHVWDHSKPDLWCEYTSRLDMICIGHAGGVYSATSAQRAEALLRILGKWVD